MNIAALGGATLDNEENYLIKKLLTALGIVQIENQARVCHSSTVVGLGTSFGRGAVEHAPGRPPELGPDRARGFEHGRGPPGRLPVGPGGEGARRDRDPHRSALQPHERPRRHLRAAARRTDIAFLGGIINHVLATESDFREYVLAYTNAPTIVGEEFADAGADGIFSGYDPESGSYDPSSWQYEGAFVAAAAGQRDQEGNLARHGADGAGQSGESARGTPKLDSTLQHPRCVYQILKRHYASYTPEMVERVCGVPPGPLRAGVRPVRAQLRPRAHDRLRPRRRLDAAHDRLPVHPGGVDPATAARQHGSSGRRRDGDARPRVDPGIERHPDALRHPARIHPDAACASPSRGSTASSTPTRLPAGSGATCATTPSAC